eukprot:TRINITY_DN187_c0_g1_i3.p2 TRINITY_DN187_c0_g1~~TRINITY_DN187_c0_g1_i3.p2  ORF type:complete len:295 (-),score=41.71 TRINITY_DN187_c0_g1_i3:2688-3572(-)
MDVLSQLGITASPKKCVPPCHKLSYLGVVVDTSTMSISIPSDKIAAISSLIEKALGREISFRKVRSLAGKLSWVSSCIAACRPFTGSVHRWVALMQQKGGCSIRIPTDARSDLEFFRQSLLFIQGRFSISLSRTRFQITTDASGWGMGAVLQPSDQQMALRFSSHQEKHLSSSAKELCAITEALFRWVNVVRGGFVSIRSDNTPSVAAVSKLRSQSFEMRKLLKRLALFLVEFDIVVQAEHIAGKDNHLADRLSRACCGCAALPLTDCFPYRFCSHCRAGAVHGSAERGRPPSV